MKHSPGQCRALPGFSQGGFTLMELLVAMTISVVAVSAMLITMANTLGTGSQTIQMTHLSDELRAGMQIMTRELRRANYHKTFMACYGNVDCRGSGTLDIAAKVKDIGINADGDCIWFWYDRPPQSDGTDPAVTGDYVAAFRRDTNADGIGSLQMMTDQTGAPDCDSDANWVDITDDDVVDVQSFTASNTDSYTETINDAGDTQSVQRITLTITGRLVQTAAIPDWLKTAAAETKTVQDHVFVRNNTTSPAS